MWVWILEWITTNVVAWVAAGIDFNGVPVDFGPLAGGVRFQRFRFHGLAVDLQVGSGVDLAHITGWTSILTVSFTAGGLENIVTNVGLIWNAINGVFLAWISEGLMFMMDGVIYPVTEVKAVDAVNGNVLKLVVEMEQFGEPLQIEHYFRRTNDASVDPGSDVSLVAEYAASSVGALLGCMDVSVVIKKYRAEWRVQGASTILPRTYITNAAGGLVGTANGGVAGADASQLAYVISWYTDFSGRGERGRTFVPGTSHAFIEENRVTDLGVIALTNYVTLLLAAFNGDTNVAKAWQMVLWRQHLTNPALVPGDDGQYANPLNMAVPPSVAEWPGHDDEGKPIYVNPPTTRPPFSPAAAQHGITLGTPQDKVKTQRRRGPGVRISRHRALVG